MTHGFYTARWQEQFYTTFTLFFTFILPLSILFLTCISTFAAISSENFKFIILHKKCNHFAYCISESEKIFLDVMIEQSQQLKDLKRSLSSNSNRQRIMQKAKIRSLQISLVIIIAFLVCWIPYNMMMLIFMFWQPNDKVLLFNFK